MFIYTLLKSEGNRHKSYGEGECQELITDTDSVRYTKTGPEFTYDLHGESRQKRRIYRGFITT